MPHRGERFVTGSEQWRDRALYQFTFFQGSRSMARQGGVSCSSLMKLSCIYVELIELLKITSSF
jgi:hypothetical protein